MNFYSTLVSQQKKKKKIHLSSTIVQTRIYPFHETTFSLNSILFSCIHKQKLKVKPSTVKS